MTAIQSSASSGYKTLRLTKEMICWRFRSISLSLLGMLPLPQFGRSLLPKRIKELIPSPESLEAEIRAARLARLKAEAKLAATVRQGDEVRRVVRVHR